MGDGVCGCVLRKGHPASSYPTAPARVWRVSQLGIAGVKKERGRHDAKLWVLSLR